jgi:hypothetical protein
MMQPTKQKTAAELRVDRDQAQADLATAEARATALENAGTVTEATVTELATCNARAQLLRGAIRRLEQEIPQVERFEATQEIERLRAVAAREDAAGEREAAKLAAAACKILLPPDDCHPAWSFTFCRRRENEILSFAQQHPAARKHTDRARDAKAEIERLETKLRG